MKEWVMFILIKKRYSRDMRNYLRIILLNTYKLLARILADRSKLMVDRFIWPYQMGFVPGRQITDNTRLCQLLQASLKERDDEELMLILDPEKGADRISHEHLLEALQAAGIGKSMRLNSHF